MIVSMTSDLTEAITGLPTDFKETVVDKALSPSRQLAAKVIFAAMNILSRKGGEAPGREIIDEIEITVPLDQWAKSVYEKTGYTRWKSILHFFTIDLAKAGYLTKK